MIAHEFAEPPIRMGHKAPDLVTLSAVPSQLRSWLKERARPLTRAQSAADRIAHRVSPRLSDWELPVMR